MKSKLLSTLKKSFLYFLDIDEETYKEHYRHVPDSDEPYQLPLPAYIALYIFLLLIILFCLIGCHTVKDIQKTDSKTDSTNVQNHSSALFLHDSVFIHDSVYITEKVRNDTVIIVKDKIHVVEKEKIKTLHDTLFQYIAVHDTLTDIQIQTKEIKKASPFLITCTCLFWLFIVFLIARIALKIYKKMHGF